MSGTKRMKAKNSGTKSSLSGQSSNQWVINNSNGGATTISLPNTTQIATTGFVQHYHEATHLNNQKDHFSIKIKAEKGLIAKDLIFFSEEEFVFSFLTLYNDMQQGKRYSATSNGVIEIQTIISIDLVEIKNGVGILISPFYVLEKAKELKYDKSK